MKVEDVLDRIDANLPQAIDRLFGLLRIPSISTDPAYAAHCREAADWLAQELSALGFQASVRPTPGHPMVVAHSGGAGPRILFYGHYDVQPVDPLDQWHRDPFDPAIEETPNGPVIRARGASDDKGQLMTFIEACRAWKEVHGSLPPNLTIFLEGEEESGSPSLVPFLEKHREELQGQIALVCDTSMVAPGVPSIASQLRGMLKDEFTIHGPRVDLHSGHYGGPALNPLREMARIVASFHDHQTGRVAVKDFYERVHEVPAELLKQWETCGFDEREYLESIGMTMPHGEKGYSTLEQQWARPTLEINGMWGGYQGAGSKTVIPATAHCKLTCRLVGDMDPDKVRARIRAHVEERLSPDARVTWDQDLDGAPASVMDTSRPEFRAAREALSEEWGREAVFVGMGGSIPIVGMFKRLYGMESLLVGFANDDDAIHSPNEKYDVKSFHKGMRSWARILARMNAM